MSMFAKKAEEKAEWERKVEHEKKKTLLEFEAAQAKAAQIRAESAGKGDEEKKAATTDEAGGSGKE